MRQTLQLLAKLYGECQLGLSQLLGQVYRAVAATGSGRNVVS